MLVILFCLLVALLILSAFFSASESSLFSLRGVDVTTLAEKGGATGRRIARALERPGYLLTTILVGNTLVNVAGAAVAAAICGILWGHKGVAAAIVIDTALVLAFGEITPKTIAVSFPLPVARVLIGPLTVFVRLVRPVAEGVSSFSNLILTSLALVRREELERRPAVGPTELGMLMHEIHEEEAFTKEERRIATNVLEFAETRAQEIMTPRVDIVAANREATREEIAALMRKAKHSKVPVYERSVDNILGFISTKEFLLWPDKPLEPLIKPVLFVPSSRRLEVLLPEMEKKRAFVVIVVNEYGETLGLITKEDILEEIVGEIHDEYEVDQVVVRHLEDGALLIDGRAGLDLVSEELGVKLGSTGTVTLNGFIFERLGRVPAKGAAFEEAGYSFEVLEVRRNRVTKCRVRKVR